LQFSGTSFPRRLHSERTRGVSGRSDSDAGGRSRCIAAHPALLH
jgi:hypothetical protein